MRDVHCQVDYGCNYRGFVKHTETGKECLDWKNSEYLPEGYGTDSWHGATNLCRNPPDSPSEVKDGVWCYTEPDKGENCAVRRCQDCDHGKWSVHKLGHHCSAWLRSKLNTKVTLNHSTPTTNFFEGSRLSRRLRFDI